MLNNDAWREIQFARRNAIKRPMPSVGWPGFTAFHKLRSVFFSRHGTGAIIVARAKKALAGTRRSRGGIEASSRRQHRVFSRRWSLRCGWVLRTDMVLFGLDERLVRS